jgi:tetratricopeptide (TPR) repeat protein
MAARRPMLVKCLACLVVYFVLLSPTFRYSQLWAAPQGQADSTRRDHDIQKLFEDALTAQKRGEMAAAESKFKELVQLRPDMTAAHANLGVVLASLGRYDEAITQYHIALSQAPGDAGLRLDLGLAYYKKGDFAGAAAEFASLHKEYPADARIATLFGNCEVELGLVGQAVALLEPLEKANSDNLDFEWALGMALIRAGRTRDGLQRVQKVADRGQNAEAYQLAANLYLGLTYFDTAKRDAEAVLGLNPRAAKAHVVLGMVANYSGDEKTAEAEFHKALEIDPNDLQARVQLGSVFYNERKLDAARKELSHALAQDPKLYSALYLMGRVERAQGNLQAALKNFESAERESPRWLEPHIELAALYYVLKRPEDGARERKIVDQLRTEERQRHSDTRIILPRVPSQ